MATRSIEVFDRQHDKWVFLDVYNNVHAVDGASGEPLSALEFRDFALGRRPATIIHPNGPGRLGYSIEGKLVEYYRRGAGEWYLWWGDSVFTYDAHPAVRAAGRVSRVLEQLVAITVGVHPRIKVLTTTENVTQLERMERLRWSLLASAILVDGVIHRVTGAGHRAGVARSSRAPAVGDAGSESSLRRRVDLMR